MVKYKKKQVLCSTQRMKRYASFLIWSFEEVIELDMKNNRFAIILYTEGENSIPAQEENLDFLAYYLSKRWGNLENRDEQMEFFDMEHLKKYSEEARCFTVTHGNVRSAGEIGWIQTEVIPVGEDILLLAFKRIQMKETEVLQVLMDQLIFKESDLYMQAEEKEKDFLLKRAMEEAKKDSLTGLYNRKTVNMMVNYTLEKEQQRAALIFIDLDNFKIINDQYGHVTGDEVLKSVAHNLHNCVSSMDIVGRVGGDEFVIVLPEVDSREEQGEDFIKTICCSIQMALLKERFDTALTCSIGVAYYPDDGIDYLTLVTKADEALYRAKNKGKNCVVFYGSGIIS